MSRRLERALARLATNCMAGVFALAVLEVLLRAFPKTLLPRGAYGAGAYSAELGMTLHSGRVIYNKLRFVERTANADGFMDVDHLRDKPPDALRVGFFGDSYVESIQVPLEAVFFRRLQPRVAGRPLEAFGFGKSGWGAVQELVVWRTFGPRYGLDVVCYVFVENDPGDSSFGLAQQQSRLIPSMPFAVLSDAQAGFELRWLSPPGERSFAVHVAKVLQQRSLVVQLVEARLELLRQQGVRARSDPKAGDMNRAAASLPDSNDLPSSWPTKLLDDAKQLNTRIVAAWRDEVTARGAHFFILYVPRGEKQLTGELPIEETWRPWLGELARSLGIPLLDPSGALAKRLATGQHVFDDHFSFVGHEVVAAELTRYLATLVQAPDARASR